MEKKKKNRKKWNKYLIAGLVMTGISLTLGIVGLFWTPYSTTAMSAAEKFATPSLQHLFGTDNFGRDIFSRVMKGCSTTLAISFLVVLFSGASILVRMWNEKRKADSVSAKKVISDGKNSASSNPSHPKSIADHMGFLIFLGITTGAICSLSGAGGPVLVMPLLVACGVSARIAVGVALFDSVFIAIPACIGYLSRITWTEILGLLVLIVLTHGIGVWLGSRFAGKVPVQGLKIFVAVFSVCIAIYMLA